MNLKKSPRVFIKRSKKIPTSFIEKLRCIMDYNTTRIFNRALYKQRRTSSKWFNINKFCKESKCKITSNYIKYLLRLL